MGMQCIGMQCIDATFIIKNGCREAYVHIHTYAHIRTYVCRRMKSNK